VKKYVRPSTTTNKVSKEKGKKNNSLSEVQNIEAQPRNVNLQVDEEFLAFLNTSITRISLTSFTKVTVKVEGDAQNEEHIGEALQNILPLKAH
jgi:hypothetical protein